MVVMIMGNDTNNCAIKAEKIAAIDVNLTQQVDLMGSNINICNQYKLARNSEGI